jgi:hypothetical protein
MSVSCACCVLSGRGLCDKLITCPEESYWLWCIIVCDLETLWMRRPWPTGGWCGKREELPAVYMGTSVFKFQVIGQLFCSFPLSLHAHISR